MKVLLVLATLAVASSGLSQSNLSAEFVGLTVHPGGDASAQFQPNKLDPKAQFVMNYGAVLTYEKFVISDVLAVRGLQCIASDCSAGWASITQIAVKGLVIRQPRHRLGLALGPVFMVRESWSRFEGYESSGYLKEGHSDLLGPVQYKFFPVAAEIEYEFVLSNRWDFTVGLTPNLPIAITMAAGFRYWFNKDFDQKLYLPKVK